MRRVITLIVILLAVASTRAAELDPKAIAVQLPKEIKWNVNEAAGTAQAILVGDPSKPGLYVVLQKWLPHNNSRPHSHPNDRYITVLKGTWWVNTGPDYDPDGMKPVPAGSFVIHYGQEMHYDGAKDEECVLEIVGMGPANNPPAQR